MNKLNNKLRKYSKLRYEIYIAILLLQDFYLIRELNKQAL